jgi:hypothetical protein
MLGVKRKERKEGRDSIICSNAALCIDQAWNVPVHVLNPDVPSPPSMLSYKVPPPLPRRFPSFHPLALPGIPVLLPTNRHWSPHMAHDVMQASTLVYCPTCQNWHLLQYAQQVAVLKRSFKIFQQPNLCCLPTPTFLITLSVPHCPFCHERSYKDDR